MDSPCDCCCRHSYHPRPRDHSPPPYRPRCCPTNFVYSHAFTEPVRSDKHQRSFSIDAILSKPAVKSPVTISFSSASTAVADVTRCRYESTILAEPQHFPAHMKRKHSYCREEMTKGPTMVEMKRTIPELVVGCTDCHECRLNEVQGHHRGPSPLLADQSQFINQSHIIDISPDSSKRTKRKRTIFTTEQLERLEHEFQHQQYIVGQERKFLAAELDLNEIQVKVWFQNRRIKWRKQRGSQCRIQHTDIEDY